jgi:tetratricopeptide (TPR) repeat protein
VANEDRFLLANLFMLDGQTEKARPELRKLLAARRDDPEPRYLNTFAQFCLQNGETTDAELHLNALQKVAPDDLSTVDLNAQVLFAKNRFSEVTDLVKKTADAANQENSKGDTNLTIQLWAARRLEDFSKRLLGKEKNKVEEAKRVSESARYRTESEGYYKRVVENHPEEALRFAESLAKSGKIDQALDMLQEDGPKANPVRIAVVAVAVMKNPDATSQKFDRLRSILNTLSQNREATLMLDLVVADLDAWRKNVKEAIGRYREVIRRDEHNIAALNNLAYILSVTGGNPDEALELVNKAIDAGGPRDALLDTRGLIYLALGKTEETTGKTKKAKDSIDSALINFTEAIAEKDSADREFHLAMLFAHKKQFAIAKTTFDKAETLGLAEQELHPLERSNLKNLRDQISAAAKQ